ncbi:MAG: tetratricopeptide repeat protein [Clostridia bacterium]|nr:tetratricopeptide repeat protein [Clostridia bacterium]
MNFPDSRILTTQQLIQQFIESNANGERFCFILGSGASVESGIPSGNTLEMVWMDCIMGKSDDYDTKAKSPDFTRQWAKKLYEDKLINHKFSDIEDAWKAATKNKKSITSKYYFDIYKLRFYPNRRNGYRYLERIMEGCNPSLGYHTLSLLLTKTNQNNLVITTNFDNLVEDALFLFTNKKPLVIGHESLANYIESDIQRPIIAKVHRGLMYAPFNTTETTNELKAEWRDALNYVFNTYTPIVIGYGGGDNSLMSFLKEDSTSMRHGIYWCYRESSGLPEKSIQDFIQGKDGYFVSIGGFDALMMEFGKVLYEDIITPTGTYNNLKNQYDKRAEQYKKQWDKLNENPDFKQVLQSMNDSEKQEETERAKENKLTAWDYTRRGDRAYTERNYKDAIEAYTKAIDLRNDFASDYNNRGCAYCANEDYQLAIEDFSKAIELDENYVEAYNNRGYIYDNQGMFDKALSDYTKAIKLSPNNAIFFNNRGYTLNNMGLYLKAIEDFTKSINLQPDANPYRHRGNAYYHIQRYDSAISDLSKAIELNSKYKEAYIDRSKVYKMIGKPNLAKADEKIASSL